MGGSSRLEPRRPLSDVAKCSAGIHVESSDDRHLLSCGSRFSDAAVALPDGTGGIAGCEVRAATGSASPAAGGLLPARLSGVDVCVLPAPGNFTTRPHDADGHRPPESHI